MKGSKISLYGKINSGLCIGVYQPKECQGAMKDMFTRKASNARSRLQFAHANYTEPLWVLDSTFETHCWLMLAALIPLDHTTPRESKKLMSSPCCRSFYPESVKTSQVDIDHDVECLLWHSYFFSSMSSTVPQGFNIILQHPVLTLYLKLLIILGTSVNAAPRDRLWKVSNC